MKASGLERPRPWTDDVDVGAVVAPDRAGSSLTERAYWTAMLTIGANERAVLDTVDY